MSVLSESHNILHHRVQIQKNSPGRKPDSTLIRKIVVGRSGFSKHGIKITCDSEGKTTNREVTAVDTEEAELLRN